MGLGRFQCLDRGTAAARPTRASSTRARDLLPPGDGSEPLLDRPGLAVWRGDSRPGGARAGWRILRWLRYREEPLGGQRVRLRLDLLLLCCSWALPVPGTLLGGGRRTGIKGDLYCPWSAAT